MKHQRAFRGVVLFLTIMFFAGIAAEAQSEDANRDSDLSQPMAHIPPPQKLQVLYTGRLMGYFRIPTWQPGNTMRGKPIQGCDQWKGQEWSEDVKTFDAQRQSAPGAILVGTGDNFAPEIEARDFWPPPIPLKPKNDDFEKLPVSRDQYYWYPELKIPDKDKDGNPIHDRWITSDEAKDLPNLQSALSEGWGVIPTDNVGCFLIQEKYAAVVPGRHDFYFGPERLRELARFLASTPVSDGQPVQMLGANLVIETTWKTGHKPLADIDYKLAFVPHWPAKYAASNDDLPAVISPADGGKVYPWLPAVTLKIKSLDGELSSRLKEKTFDTADPAKGLADFLKDAARDHIENGAYQDALKRLLSDLSKIIADPMTMNKIYICRSTTVGDPNHIPEPGKSDHCNLLQKHYFAIADGAIEYVLPLTGQIPSDYFPKKPFSEEHFFNLVPGENYGLCLKGPSNEEPSNLPEIENAPMGGGYYCQRFSVYWPLFSFHTYHAKSTDPTDPPLQADSVFHEPEPYVFLPADASKGRPVDVAIFGIVDPAMTEYVGGLNLAWQNERSKYKTTVAINYPVEALREITGYFAMKYRERNGRDFDGVKILLAEMSPARAKVLAAHFREFQIVVSAADDDLETTAQEETITRPRASRPKTFVAVPAGYYRTRTPAQPYIEIGSLTLTATDTLHTTPAGGAVSVSKLFSTRLGRSPGTLQTDAFPGWFTHKVETASGKCFGPSKRTLTTLDRFERLQLLTLCAMQKETGADVALLQSRDFFGYWPESQSGLGPSVRDNQDDSKIQAQLFLDRIVWKGDFLTLVYVPGSALQKAMEQSKKYESDDASALSLSDEHDRGLIAVGLGHDASRDECLINEVPLDKNRLYAVATSDFIAAGGTGYPDFAAAIVKAPQSPQDLPDEMQTISGLVCRKLEGSKASGYCQSHIPRDQYFDSLAMDPTDQRKGDSPAHELWAWSFFHHAQRIPKAKTASMPSGGKKPAAPAATLEQFQAPLESVSQEPTLVPTPDSKLSAAEAAQRRVHYRGLGALRFNPPDPSPFSIDNASLGFSSVTHKFTDADRKSTFPGNPLTQLTTARSHTLQFDVRPKYSYSWHWGEVFQIGEARYKAQYTGQANASRIINQNENLLSSDTGIAFHLGARGLPSDGNKRHLVGRTLPHLEGVATIHYETQVVNPLPNFLESLSTSSNLAVAPGFDKSRTHILLARTGARWVDRAGWFEAGLETGKEFNAIRLVAPSGSSLTTVQRPDIRVSGAYWNWHLIAPFSQKVSLQIDEKGDYFFNKASDTPIDTKFRSDTEMSLNFKIWDSLSFAPTYEIFAYTNKVQQIWFWQGQADIKLKVRFDFWNHREWWGRQIRYAPAKD
jgi:hypothetical protein